MFLLFVYIMLDITLFNSSVHKLLNYYGFLDMTTEIGVVTILAWDSLGKEEKGNFWGVHFWDFIEGLDGCYDVIVPGDDVVPHLPAVMAALTPTAVG